MRFFFDEELDANLATADSFAKYMEVFAFDGPVNELGQDTIKIVDAGRLLIDFSDGGDGPGEVFRESHKLHVEIFAAITGIEDTLDLTTITSIQQTQYTDALRWLALRYWIEGEAMAIARMAAPTAPRPHSTL